MNIYSFRYTHNRSPFLSPFFSDPFSTIFHQLSRKNMYCPSISLFPSLTSICISTHFIYFPFSLAHPDYLKFSSDYSHAVVGGTSSARGMRSASELRDLMDTLQRKKIALENSLRANGNANPSYFSVTQVSHHLVPPKGFIIMFQQVL